MQNNGMTLLEVMFAVAIFTVVMGALFTLALGFGDTADIQSIQANSNDDARKALDTLVTELRQAARSSINWAQLPGAQLVYRVATDLDGNGTAVDVNGRIELSQPRTVARDLADANHDSVGGKQLTATAGDTIRVLANNVSPDSEQPDAAGVFGPAQDTNKNGRLDRGIWFEPQGRGLRITIQTQGVNRRNQVIRSTFQETVFPRN